MNDELYTFIKQSQNKNKDATMKIIERFMPLIKKYARTLNYDGADTDLIISLIKSIKKFPVDQIKLLQKDSVIVSYICISTKNEYIRLWGGANGTDKTHVKEYSTINLRFRYLNISLRNSHFIRDVQV